MGSGMKRMRESRLRIIASMLRILITAYYFQGVREVNSPNKKGVESRDSMHNSRKTTL